MDAERLKLSEIARELGLSVTTVSRVLHNRPDVKAETRKRVLEYVQGVGFYPAVAGSDLEIVGVVDSFQRHSLASYYNATLIEGIDERLYGAGYITAIVHSEVIDREQRAYENVRLLNRLAGLVWLGPVFDKHYREVTEKHNIPCVVVNGADREVAVDLVDCDSYKAAVTATEYLLGLGHTRIAFIGGQVHDANMVERRSGYEAALRAARITVDTELLIDDISLWNDEGGAEGVYRLMSRPKKPTAILVASDFLLRGVYRAIGELGYTVPETMSVVSFDDSPIATSVSPPVTSCQQPLEQIASIATETLIRLMASGSQGHNARRRTLNMPFMVRKSTAPPPKM